METNLKVYINMSQPFSTSGYPSNILTVLVDDVGREQPANIYVNYILLYTFIIL